MTRGEVNHVKVHYKGNDEDFVVFLDSVEDYKRWLGDKSVPLAQVVSSFKVFTTHRSATPFFFFCCCLFCCPSRLTLGGLGVGDWLVRGRGGV